MPTNDPSRTPEDLIHDLRAIRLSEDTKERMRADLSSYADLHSMEAGSAEPIRSPYFGFFARTRSLYAGALALLLMVAGGTQASLAAENTKPGDLLYPIKVAISEPMALTFALSSEQKAGLAARFASRRVEEAAALSSEGKLDQATAGDLASRFDAQVDLLAKETTALEAKGEIAVSLAVRTDLEQTLTERVESFSVREAGEEDVLSAKAVVDDSAANQFADRVFEKSRTLATTRERLESVLSTAAAKENVDLALLRKDDTGDATATMSSTLFSAQPASISASSTATTTATSTPEFEEEPVAAPSSRFFAPFFNR